ncbi:hypothetical protein ABPG74_018946 [Tetrahymena malaccensis]
METLKNNTTCFDFQQLREKVTQNTEVFILGWLPDERQELKTHLRYKQIKLKNLTISCGEECQNYGIKLFEIKENNQSEERVLQSNAQFLLQTAVEIEFGVWLKQGDSLQYFKSQTLHKVEEEEQEGYYKSLDKIISFIQVFQSAKSLNFILSTKKLSEENQSEQLVQLFAQIKQIQGQQQSINWISMLAEDFSLKGFKKNSQISLEEAKQESEFSIENELQNCFENKDCLSFLNLSFYEKKKLNLLDKICGFSNQFVFQTKFWSYFLGSHKMFYDCFGQIKQEIKNLINCQEYCKIEDILKLLLILKQMELKCISATFEDIKIILLNKNLYEEYESILREDKNLTTYQEIVIKQTFQYFCWVEKIKKYFDENQQFIKFNAVYQSLKEKIVQEGQNNTKKQFRYFSNNSGFILNLDFCIFQYKQYLLEQQSGSLNCQQDPEQELNYFSNQQLLRERIQRIIVELRFFISNQDYTLIDVESIQILGLFVKIYSGIECEIKQFYHEFISQLKEKIESYLLFIEECDIQSFTNEKKCAQYLMNLYLIITNRTIFCEYLGYTIKQESLYEKITQFLVKMYLNNKITQIDLLILLMKFAKLTKMLILSLNKEQLEINIKYESRIITIYKALIGDVNQYWELFLDENCSLEKMAGKVDNINVNTFIIDLIVELQQSYIDQKIVCLEEWRIRLKQFVMRQIQLCQEYLILISKEYLSRSFDDTIQKICFYRSYFRKLIKIFLLIQEYNIEIVEIVYLIDQKLYFVFQNLGNILQVDIDLSNLHTNSEVIIQRFSQHKNLNLLYENEIVQIISMRFSNANIYQKVETQLQICNLDKDACLQNKCNKKTFQQICKLYEKAEIINKSCSLSGYQNFCSLFKKYSQSFIKIVFLKKISVIIHILLIVFCVFQTVKTSRNHQQQDQNEFYNLQPFSGSIVKEAQRDQFGNPQSSSFDLAKDNSFNEFSLLIGQFFYEYRFDLTKNVIPAIKEKGIKNYKIINDEQQFINELPLFDQAWILSGYEFANKQTKISDFIEAVLNHLSKQKGLALWADNEPYFKHANIILDQIPIGYENNSPIKIQLYENFRGQNILKKGQNNKQQEFGFHMLTIGLETLYEGDTICAPQIISNTNSKNYGELEIIGTSSHNLPAFMSLPGTKKRGRIVIDCGFTKLYDQNWFTTAGTQRYVKNLYAWLFWREKPTK